MKVTINVSPYEVLSELDDDDLREECRERGIALAGASPVRDLDDDEVRRLADDLREAFEARDRTHFDALLARLTPRPSLPAKAFRGEVRT